MAYNIRSKGIIQKVSYKVYSSGEIYLTVLKGTYNKMYLGVDGVPHPADRLAPLLHVRIGEGGSGTFAERGLALLKVEPPLRRVGWVRRRVGATAGGCDGGRGSGMEC